ncbi:MAG: hypothetical protein LBK73_08885 [Treponema sp.]|jgi:hypothetical protein|nr:hypothetical protein [Treponema sp.]
MRKAALQQYHFLSRESYDAFFNRLKNGTVIEEKCIRNLEIELNAENEITDE